MSKKILFVVLAIAILLTPVSPALAQDKTPPEKPEGEKGSASVSITIYGPRNPNAPEGAASGESAVLASKMKWFWLWFEYVKGGSKITVNDLQHAFAWTVLYEGLFTNWTSQVCQTLSSCSSWTGYHMGFSSLWTNVAYATIWWNAGGNSTYSKSYQKQF